MTRLIGINGYKRSGKGETGAAIQAISADNFHSTTLLGFADKLKILASKTLGFTERSDAECIALMDECKEEWIFSIIKQVEHHVFTEAGGDFPFKESAEWHRLTGREYLQNLGTEARTVFGADFWVDQVLPKAPTYPSYGPKLVEAMYGTDYVAFTDVRFENEAQRILDLGGEVWEVLRPDTGSDGHASEQPLPGSLVTRQIINDGSLLNLRWHVDQALGY